MKTYKYDIRLDEDRLPMLVKDCTLTYRAAMKHDCSEKIADWLEWDMDMHHLANEKVVCMMYDISCRMIGYRELASGSAVACPVSAKDVYQTALAVGADAVVIAHNHPSGGASPSKDDLNVMEWLSEAGKLIGIQLLDFLIIGNRCYWSAAEQQGKRNAWNQ